MAALDKLYRSILVAVRFFPKGWGPTHAYESLARFNPVLVNREECAAALQNHCHQVSLTQVSEAKWGTTFTGSFLSPTCTLLPGILPPESEIARFELLLPKEWTSQEHKPIYIHLAGTGDHGFYRRRHMTALPLLKRDKIGALILENPFYGSRKPKHQRLSQLLHVSDLFTGGLSLILECLVLKRWLEERGFGPIGLTGLSMGGHNASLCGAVWPEPVPVVPCLSWSTASSAFTQGMLSGAVSWDVLEEQLANCRSSGDKIRKKIFDFARDVLVKQQSPVYCGLTRDEASARSLWMSSSTSENHSTSAQNITLPRINSDLKHTYRSWLVNTKKARENSAWHWETVSTLKAVLDLSTHLCNYPLPLQTNLASFVVAKRDLYIPRHNITNIETVWPGCEVNYVDGGHVSATLLQQKAFRNTLAVKMKEKIAMLAA